MGGWKFDNAIGALMVKFSENRRGPPAAGTDLTIAVRLDRDQVVAILSALVAHLLTSVCCRHGLI
jgi:hypothetical protein